MTRVKIWESPLNEITEGRTKENHKMKKMKLLKFGFLISKQKHLKEHGFVTGFGFFGVLRKRKTVTVGGEGEGTETIA